MLKNVLIGIVVIALVYVMIITILYIIKSEPTISPRTEQASEMGSEIGHALMNPLSLIDK
jgi:hypothetical protein